MAATDASEAEAPTFMQSLRGDVRSPKYYLGFNIFLSRFVGLNPPRGHNLLLTMLPLTWTIMLVHLVCEIIDLSLNLQNVSLLAKNLPISSLVAGAWYRLTYYTVYRDDYNRLIEQVGRIFLPGTEKRMRRWLKQSRISILVYFSYGTVSCLYWLFHPLLVQQTFGIVNVTATNGSFDQPTSVPHPVLFPSGAWYPFEVETPKAYASVYAFQCIAIFFAAMLIMATDIMFITLMLLTCGQFEELGETLRHAEEIAKLNSEKSKVDEEEELNTIVVKSAKYHYALLQMVSDIEDMHWSSMLVNFSLQLLILSFLAFEATSSTESSPLKGTNLIGYLLMAILQLYLLCYSGDQLMESEFLVARAAYESQWFATSERFKRNLRFIVLRAQKPQRITVGKVAGLNLVTFSDTLSRAFSYFTVLRQVRNSEIVSS